MLSYLGNNLEICGLIVGIMSLRVTTLDFLIEKCWKVKESFKIQNIPFEFEIGHVGVIQGTKDS